VTDACVVLGYLDPDYFLGGAHKLDAAAAAAAITQHCAGALRCSVEEAAASIIALATENMVQAIVDITVNQGIDPADALLIGGGGAAGLNSVFIARRLGCGTLIFPEVGAALSAAGALISDLTAEYRGIRFTTTNAFDRDAVNALLGDLERHCGDYAAANGDPALGHTIEFVAEARYPSQAWEIEVALPTGRFENHGSVAAFEQAFHAAHERLFAISDPGSVVEIVGWSATVRCRLRAGEFGRLAVPPRTGRPATRKAYFSGPGWVDVPVMAIEAVSVTDAKGPALIESPFTTVVVDPGATFRLTDQGNLIVQPCRGMQA
jgi:N-methylhydantoinase A